MCSTVGEVTSNAGCRGCGRRRAPSLLDRLLGRTEAATAARSASGVHNRAAAAPSCHHRNGIPPRPDCRAANGSSRPGARAAGARAGSMQTDISAFAGSSEVAPTNQRRGAPPQDHGAHRVFCGAEFPRELVKRMLRSQSHQPSRSRPGSRRDARPCNTSDVLALDFGVQVFADGWRQCDGQDTCARYPQRQGANTPLNPSHMTQADRFAFWPKTQIIGAQ